MNELFPIEGWSIAQLVLAMSVVAFIVERFGEYLVARVLGIVYSATNWEPEPVVQMTIISVVNFVIYIGLLRFDFMGPLLASVGVTVGYWEGILLSGIAIAGGSNLVHEIVKLLPTSGLRDPEDRI